MAVCLAYGPPDLFVTFICNPKWPEIIDALWPGPGQRPHDRSDMEYRVFNLKLKDLFHGIKAMTVSSPIRAAMYSTEFQKRGLPHVHILVWLSLPQQPETIISRIPALEHSTLKKLSNEDKNSSENGLCSSAAEL